MGLLGLVIVTALAASALLANVIAPYDPNVIDIPNRFAPPSADHPLGTDQLGRDVFSRTLYGGRIALLVALVSTGSAAAIGLVIGLLAAYGPRVVDNTIVLVLDTMRCYPTIIFALAVGPLFGAGLGTVIAIIVVTTTPYYGRIVRTQALALKRSEFILSAESSGASRARVIFLHLLPNILGPVLILASMDIPIVIGGRSEPELPRGRREAAHSELGHHPRRRLPLGAAHVVARHRRRNSARPRHPRFHLPRRSPARYLRSQARATLLAAI